MISLDFGLAFVACDQLSQTGMDLPCRQQLTVPRPGCDCPVLTWPNLITVSIHCTGHQNLMELPDKLLSKGFHHMVNDIVDTVDMVQHLNHIRHLHRFKGLPNLTLSEDGFHLLTGQSATGHAGGRVSKVNHHKIVQSVKIALFLLIFQLFGEFWQHLIVCIRFCVLTGRTASSGMHQIPFRSTAFGIRPSAQYFLTNETFTTHLSAISLTFK